MRVTACVVIFPDGTVDPVIVREDGTLDVPQERRADALLAIESMCRRLFPSAFPAASGGRARAASLSPERRAEIARNAVRARWATRRKGQPSSP